MATQTERLALPLKPNSRQLSRERVVELYRTMLLSRRLDDREILLKRQQRIFFQISGAGHEAVLAAAGELLRPAADWFYPYYRDRALCLRLGVTPKAMLLAAVGAADDPGSGGRQMPSHWSDAGLHIVSSSSPTGTQFLQAIGCAEAGRYFHRHGELAPWLQRHCLAHRHPTWQGDEVVYVSGGDGATSEGEFWEAVGAAARERLPVLFLIEDNGYAISVPVEVQTAGGSISRLLTGFPHLRICECDGCDLFDSYAALEDAVAHCRSGAGPALVHAHVVRPYSHSLSDDERLYKPEAERAEEEQRDPIRRLAAFLRQQGWADEAEFARFNREIEAKVLASTDAALAAEPPAPSHAFDHLYSPDVDSCAAAFASPAPDPGGPGKTMVEAINECLRDEMKRDPRIVVFGEDVADVSRDEYLDQVKGKGGVFKASIGLQRQFGADRCFNTPLAEAAIVGRAIGMATRGLKPVAEIQFFDYIWPAMMQIRSELATLRWRSMGGFAAPVVLRAPIGGYLTGGAIYHSQSGESIFTHLPGLRVVMPSDALDANGLLRTALRGDDPVLFLEHKRLYREPFNRGPYPGPDYCVPFGAARVVRAGGDLTIVTYGALVQRSLQAAQRAHQEGLGEAEVLDLRSLSPYDWDAIVASVGKTNRVIVAYEDVRSWGYGAEIAARIGEELFTDLDAPVRRVAAKDLYCAYQPRLEEFILPQAADVYEAVVQLLRY
ncbi:MAG: alpha-ketoacid dehydrogenase subunit alpha/beta [Terriglobales bacterium]